MNSITISGYVKYLEEIRGGYRFKLVVSRGSRGDRDGQKRFTIPVKAFGEGAAVIQDSFAVVHGSLDSHQYNGKDIFEITCSVKDVVSRGSGKPTDNPNFPPGYPVPPADSYSYDDDANTPF